MRALRIASAFALVIAGLGAMGIGRAATTDAPPTIEKKGCCSHHKGVCGCSDGRAQCCDGTLSPTCGC